MFEGLSGYGGIPEVHGYGLLGMLIIVRSFASKIWGELIREGLYVEGVDGDLNRNRTRYSIPATIY